MPQARDPICIWCVRHCRNGRLGTKNQTEFYRLYARLIPSESTTEISVRDAEGLSTEELLAIARAAHARSEEAEPDVELYDDLHRKIVYRG
jgi:hypothetical protein